MARLVPQDKNGRFALVEGDRTLGYGHLEIPFVPEGNDQAITGIRFVMEPRQADDANARMLQEANSQ